MIIIINSSILDIEHYPYYIVFGSTQNYIVIYWRPKHLKYIYMCVCVCVLTSYFFLNIGLIVPLLFFYKVFFGVK